MTSRAGRLTEALRALLGPVLAPVARRVPELAVGAAVLLSVLGVLTLVGAARDDAAISAHLGTATAQVLDGSTWHRTLVRFSTPDGQVRTPELGVFYPSGLLPGQVVRVEYDAQAPELVRVGGRGWTLGAAPVLGGITVLWLFTLPTVAWLRARRRRRRTTRVAGAGAAG